MHDLRQTGTWTLNTYSKQVFQHFVLTLSPFSPGQDIILGQLRTYLWSGSFSKQIVLEWAQSTLWKIAYLLFIIFWSNIITFPPLTSFFIILPLFLEGTPRKQNETEMSPKNISVIKRSVGIKKTISLLETISFIQQILLTTSDVSYTGFGTSWPFKRKLHHSRKTHKQAVLRYCNQYHC